ncbi:MAG: DNA polymerase III subunit gamma/tau [Pyrinomonadaceae bacterium]|nr:DNA polymerase III subunit gamma/tau [Pyrinomonadaceae bacterium]
MSYQVIARKWRPQTFEEVTGQEIITHTLRNAIEHDRLHHAYLFSGARGVGKTTTARLLAKSLNCHKTPGPNLTPCSGAAETMCPSCLEISESRSIDVLEIDAASHTGIDDVRETIIESINFNPARDRFKVFIIDEVHQLSKPAFNALLKTLEEPPERVVFVMATTELHKVPDTILSRCQEFQFRTIPLQKIYDRLKLIAEAERIDISEEALREIARSGEGSMRDAQSNFDQVISFSGETITAADVTNSLGFAGVEILTRVVNAVTSRDSREILSVVDDLVGRGHDLRNFCRDLLGMYRDLLVFKVAGNDPKFFETAVIGAEMMKELSGGSTEADLLRAFNSLAETESKLKEATHSRYVVEIGLIKLIELRRVAPVEDLLKRLEGIAGGNTGPMTRPSSPPDAAEEKKTLKLGVGDALTFEAGVPEITSGAEIPANLPAENAPAPVPEPVAADETEPEFSPDSDMFDEPPFDPSYDELQAPELEVVPPAPVQKRGPETARAHVRLPSLTSEELIHFEDKNLDALYEFKLSVTDDDMMPFGETSAIIKALFVEEIEALPKIQRAVAAPRRTAPIQTYDLSDMIPADEGDVAVSDLPRLNDDPTDEELSAYAAAHPVVRRVLNVFRGRIVEVTDSRPKLRT